MMRLGLRPILISKLKRLLEPSNKNRQGFLRSLRKLSRLAKVLRQAEDMRLQLHITKINLATEKQSVLDLKAEL